MYLSRRALVIAGAVTLLLGGGTVVFATVVGSPISGGVIYGCYKTAAINGSHALVLQDAGKSCPRGDTAITWNQKGAAGPQGATGPQGPQGQTGATGPQGPQGPTGAPGTGATVTPVSPGNANCANGGASVTDGSGNTAYACNGAPGATGPAGPQGPPGPEPSGALLADQVISSGYAALPPVGTATAIATCGSGYSVTGGGYAISPSPSGNQVIQVTDSTATANGWEVTAFNEVPSSFTLRADAVCHAMSP
jgi:hypothetical protein